MSEQCPRCGGERGDGRWCATCGLDSTPTAATLPTQEAMEAGIREREWFAEHPEMQSAHEQAQEAAARKMEEKEYAQLASTRPQDFGDYRDLDWRERLACFWLFVQLLLLVAAVALAIAHLGVLGGVARGDYLDSLDVADSIDRQTTVYLVIAVAYILSGGFFIAWTWRAYKNASALGAQHLRFGPGWAIGAWFVPILSLWRPKQIVNDTWRTSDPQAPAFLRRANWNAVAVPGLLTAWWILFLVGDFLRNVGFRVRENAVTADGDRTWTILALLGSLMEVAAAVLAILVVRRITARQRERAAALEPLPAPGDAAPQAVAA